MGCTSAGLALLGAHINCVGGLRGCRILKPGKKQMFFHGGAYDGTPAKALFEAQGSNTRRSSSTGELGAVPLGLSKIAGRAEWNGAFDVAILKPADQPFMSFDEFSDVCAGTVCTA